MQLTRLQTAGLGVLVVAAFGSISAPYRLKGARQILPHTSASKLHDAAALGDAARVRSLLKAKRRRVELDQPAADGATALMVASAFGFEDVVEELLRWEPDVEAVDVSGLTALMWVSVAKGREPELSRLMPFAARAHARPRRAAPRRDHEAVARRLMTHGRGERTLEAVDHMGWSALLLAVYYGHPTLVGALVDGGARVDTSVADGRTAFELARELGRDRAALGRDRAGAHGEMARELGRHSVLAELRRGREMARARAAAWRTAPAARRRGRCGGGRRRCCWRPAVG